MLYSDMKYCMILFLMHNICIILWYEKITCLWIVISCSLTQPLTLIYILCKLRTYITSIPKNLILCLFLAQQVVRFLWAMKIGSDSLYDEVLPTTCVISNVNIYYLSSSFIVVCIFMFDCVIYIIKFICFMLSYVFTSCYIQHNQIPPNNVWPSSKFLLFIQRNSRRWLRKVVVTTNRFLSKTDIDLKSLVEVTSVLIFSFQDVLNIYVLALTFLVI